MHVFFDSFVVCLCLSVFFPMICCSNMIDMININGQECGELLNGLYFIGIDISDMSSVDVSNVLEADNGKLIDLVILDKSELLRESIESYMMSNHETNKKMIMVNIINDDNEYEISNNLCTAPCQPAISAVCGGPCCSTSVCKVCLSTGGCTPAFDEVDDENGNHDDHDNYVLSRYLFVAANCLDGKINVINHDYDKQAKQFVIIHHGGGEENKVVTIDNVYVFILLSVLFAAAFIIMIVIMAIYCKKDNINEKSQSFSNYGSV